MSLVGATKKVKNELNSRIVGRSKDLKNLSFLSGDGTRKVEEERKARKVVGLKNCCGWIKLKYALGIKYVSIHTFWRCGNV